jgi:catechol-2,3-dioxygenase
MAIFMRPTYGYEPAHRRYGSGIIFLYTENVEEVARFYIDVFGFSVKQGPGHWEEPGHSYWLDAGSHIIVIHQAEKYLPGPFDQHGNSTIFWINVENSPEDVLQGAEEKGLEVIFCDRDPNSPVRRNIVLRDIEGRPIGVYANG